MMEYQNNNGNYDKRNRRKAKKKIAFYRAACVTLCLLIVSVIFELCIFRESKDPGLLSKENTKQTRTIRGLPTIRMRQYPQFQSQPYPTRLTKFR